MEKFLCVYKTLCSELNDLCEKDVNDQLQVLKSRDVTTTIKRVRFTVL